MGIHSTAVVSPSAEIDPTAEIGPFAVIGENVRIGEDSRVGPHTVISHCRIGKGTAIGSHTAIGGNPQILDWKEVPSLVTVGDGCFINEMVSIHRSMHENGATFIGDRVMIMSNTHMGHDCRLENDVILTTYTGLSGHVTVEECAMTGGHAGVHQFVRIGAHAMVGGYTRLVQDVAPFMLCEGSPAFIRSPNLVGLKRRGFSLQARSNIKQAFKILFNSGLAMSTAREKLLEIEEENGEITRLVEFIGKSKRGLTGGRPVNR